MTDTSKTYMDIAEDSTTRSGGYSHVNGWFVGRVGCDHLINQPQNITVPGSWPLKKVQRKIGTVKKCFKSPSLMFLGHDGSGKV